MSPFGSGQEQRVVRDGLAQFVLRRRGKLDREVWTSSQLDRLQGDPPARVWPSNPELIAVCVFMELRASGYTGDGNQAPRSSPGHRHTMPRSDPIRSRYPTTNIRSTRPGEAPGPPIRVHLGLHDLPFLPSGHVWFGRTQIAGRRHQMDGTWSDRRPVERSCFSLRRRVFLRERTRDPAELVDSVEPLCRTCACPAS